MLTTLLVPQGMAYAELAGLPPITGLYTIILCLLAYAVFGPSRILVLGPDSSLGPMIAAGAKTRRTGLIGAGLIIVMIVFLPGLFRNLTSPALAAVVITAAVRDRSGRGVRRAEPPWRGEAGGAALAHSPKEQVDFGASGLPGSQNSGDWLPGAVTRAAGKMGAPPWALAAERTS